VNVFKLLFAGLILALFALPSLYLLAPDLLLGMAVRVERWHAGLEQDHVQIPGYRVAYLDSRAAAPPLLLVHGFGGDKDNWIRLAAQLEGEVRIIAPDLPGFGDSDAPAQGDYSLDAQVDNLHALIGRLGLTRVELGGNSMGGNIVARYAARHPNRVGSLWLIANSGVAAAPQSELREHIAAGRGNPLVAQDAAQYRHLLAWVMAQPPPLPNAFLDVLAERAVAVRELRQRQFHQLYDADAEPLESLLQGLPVPTHIVWGELDRVLHPGAAALLKSALPDATSTLMPGIGHLPMIEDPRAVADDYRSFRARVAAAVRP
jgi:pimeloyl-ACP methyl ester carboxylesterase